MDEILTVKELASILKTTHSSVYRWMRDCGLPSVKVGGSRRFIWSQIEVRLKTKQQSKLNSIGCSCSLE